MAILLSTFLISLCIHGVTCDYCVSSFPYTSVYCSWGCCYKFENPCCSAPVYTGAAFIVPVTISFIILFCIVAYFIQRRRRREIETVVRYQTPVTPQPIVTISPATTGDYGVHLTHPPPYERNQPKY